MMVGVMALEGDDALVGVAVVGVAPGVTTGVTVPSSGVGGVGVATVGIWHMLLDKLLRAEEEGAF